MVKNKIADTFYVIECRADYRGGGKDWFRVWGLTSAAISFATKALAVDYIQNQLLPHPGWQACSFRVVQVKTHKRIVARFAPKAT